MSADGEVQVQVSAEGADGAAQDLAEGSETDVGQAAAGGGDGGRGSGLVTAGSLAGALLVAIGPLRKPVEALLDVVNAFLAPVSVMLMRLLAPVLRFMIGLLPAWMAFIDFVSGALGWLQSQLWSFLQPIVGAIGRMIDWLAANVPDDLADIKNAIPSLPELLGILMNLGAILTSHIPSLSDIVGGLLTLGAMLISHIPSLSDLASLLVGLGQFVVSGIISFVQSLPERIGRAVAQAVSSFIPGVDSGGGGGGGSIFSPSGPFPSFPDMGIPGLGFLFGPGDALNLGFQGGQIFWSKVSEAIADGLGGGGPFDNLTQRQTQIILQGGLAPFVERVEADQNVEQP